jgi:hypothetical protein
MTADAIELKLARPLGSRELQLYLLPKNLTTKGPRQLQFDCVVCNFCGALWSTPVRKTSLYPSVLCPNKVLHPWSQVFNQKCRGDRRAEVAFPPDQGSPKSATKRTADAIELELASPWGSRELQLYLLPKNHTTIEPRQLQFNCVISLRQ